jgi:hypothetical protein
VNQGIAPRHEGNWDQEENWVAILVRFGPGWSITTIASVGVLVININLAIFSIYLGFGKKNREYEPFLKAAVRMKLQTHFIPPHFRVDW